MKLPDAILSDADGTLVNTLYLIRHGQYEATKAYLEQHGVPIQDIPGYDAYESILNENVGTSARDVLERNARHFFKSSHYLETIDFDALNAMLDPIQDEIALELVKPYPGLSLLMSKLGSMEIKLAIFTSGTPHHIVRNFGIALPELELTDLFKDKLLADREKLRIFESTLMARYGVSGFTVVTCEDTNEHKPNPAGINLAMSRLNVGPSKCLVLGDHKIDMQTGINANVPQLVGVTHGFNAGATEVIDELPELVTLLVK